ncbi:MAG: aldo/keto reductase [Bacillota bacterium]
MNYSTFKGEKLSLLGFGGMRFPINEDKSIDYEKAEAMVDYAYKNGVNYFDTAYMYHDGRSEVFFGKVLKKYPRDSYYLTNKMPVWFCETPDDMERIFQDQLKRCDETYFDFYLLHAVSGSNYQTSEDFKTVEFLQKKQAEGYIKHLGFSFHGDVPLFKEVLAKYGDVFEFCQLQLNYYDWDKIEAGKLYDLATEAGLPVIVMEPVRGGLLAKLNANAESILHAHNKEMSTASWAIRYVADLDNVMVVLSGMTTMEQTIDNVKNLSMPKMTPADQQAIQTALDVFLQCITIPCTGCSYCMPCPMGIKIPDIFAAYINLTTLGGSWADYLNSYATFEKTIKDCIHCNKCMSHCPQGLKIPELLEVAERALP